jgi:AcrR family transcriptional regulator
MSKRDDIFNTAVKEFSQYSYTDASVNRIIKASGTSKGTFYHYFPDKKALYLSIIQYAVKIKREYFGKIMEHIEKEDNDFFDMMKAQVKAGMQFMLDRPDLYRFASRYAKEESDIKTEVQEKFIPAISRSYVEIIEAAIKNGNLSDKYPADFTGRIISYITLNYYDILFDKNDSPSPEQLEEGLDMLYDFIKKGLS